MNKTETIGIRFSKFEREKIEKYCQKKDITISIFFRECLKLYDSIYGVDFNGNE